MAAPAGNWATRNTFVGLDGRFGQVMLGNYDSAYKMVKYLIPLEDGVADFTGANGIIGRGQRSEQLKNSFGASTPMKPAPMLANCSPNLRRTNAQYNADGHRFERRDDTGADASKNNGPSDFCRPIPNWAQVGYEYENQGPHRRR